MGPPSTRSSAFPCGMPSMTSKSATSPSPFSAQRCASVPPIIPAPMSAIFFRAMGASQTENRRGTQPRLHFADDRLPELGALHERRALHETMEVVRDRLGRDRALHAADDRVRGLGPAEVTEHHLAGEDDRA